MNPSRELFISEAEDMLLLMNNTLVALEKKPKDQELLNELFRAAHTIKGMAGFEGLTEIQELSHSVEDLLNAIREGHIEVTEDVMDIIFSSADQLQSLVSAVKNGEDLSDGTHLIEKMAHFKKASQPKAPKKISKPPKEKKSARASSKISKDKQTEQHHLEKRTHLRLDDSDREAIAKAAGQGLIAYEVIITLSKNCLMREARLAIIIRQLQNSGDIINTDRLMKGIRSGKYGRHLGLFYMTKKSPGQLKEALEKITDVDHIQFIVLPIDDVLLPEQTKKRKEESVAVGASGTENKDISTIRVNVQKLDRLMNLVGELVINKIRLNNISSLVEIPEAKEILSHMDRLTVELQDMATSTRLVPLSTVFDRFQRLVRDTAKEDDKQINFIIKGSDIELDRSILEGITDPLIHLLRNAVGHGIESAEVREQKGKPVQGKLTLSACREKGKVIIQVMDDGQGIDPDKVRTIALQRNVMTSEEINKLDDNQIKWLITHPGLSTQKSVDKIGGRGVGMDVAKTTTEAFGGRLLIDSELDRGSTFSLELPLSLSIIKALIVKVGNEQFAIPLINILETVRIKNESIKKMRDQEIFNLRGTVLPVLRLNKILDVKPSEEASNKDTQIVCVVEIGMEKVSLAVDGLLGQQDVVVKSLPSCGKNTKGISGVTILSDGLPCLIIDVGGLI